MPGRPVRHRVEAAKRAARPLRSSQAAGWTSRAMLRHHYRHGHPAGWLSEALHRATVYDMAILDRSATVDALVELFFDLMAVLSVDRFVEAGAKDATASCRALATTPSRQVVAFEANPFTHARFVDTVEGAGVTYEQLALSDSPGDVTFLVRLHADGTPIPDGQSSLLARPGHEPGYREVTVEAVTLDSYFGAPNGVLTAMWVDVEGASSVVLRGGTGLLADTQVLIIEVEERQSWEGQEWLRADVIRFLCEHGLVPVARDLQSRFQFNIVFVRSEASGEDGVAKAIERFRSLC